MTKELLEDYPHICARIKSLRCVERDVISMSAYNPPYVQHSQPIEGIITTDMNLLMSLKLQKLEIEEFVESLPNNELKRIAELRAFQRLKWSDIVATLSEETGIDYTVDGVKQKYYRFFK